MRPTEDLVGESALSRSLSFGFDFKNLRKSNGGRVYGVDEVDLPLQTE